MCNCSSILALHFLETSTKKDLARIRTIFPEALLFKQEKNIPGIYGHQRYSEYQLTVEAAGEDGEALPAGDSLNITVLMNRKRRVQKQNNLCCITTSQSKRDGESCLFIYTQS